MAENLIVTEVIGNLGRDAATKTLPAGQIVTETSIAVNGKNERVDWVKVKVWGNRGEGLPHLEQIKLMLRRGRPPPSRWGCRNHQ